MDPVTCNLNTFQSIEFVCVCVCGVSQIYGQTFLSSEMLCLVAGYIETEVLQIYSPVSVNTTK